MKVNGNARAKTLNIKTLITSTRSKKTNCKNITKGVL